MSSKVTRSLNAIKKRDNQLGIKSKCGQNRDFLCQKSDQWLRWRSNPESVVLDIKGTQAHQQDFVLKENYYNWLNNMIWNIQSKSVALILQSCINDRIGLHFVQNFPDSACYSPIFTITIIYEKKNGWRR